MKKAMTGKKLKPKARTLISKKGYGVFLDSITTDELENLKKTLTVKPNVMADYDFGKDNVFPVYRLSDTRIYLPKYYGLKHYGDTKNQIKDGVDANLEFSGNLKPHQVDFCNTILKELRLNNSCIACMTTGGGKTIVALWLAAQLKKRTLIIVHKEFLLNQWIERIKQFLPNASIGIIKQNKCEIDKDIIIGMIQTLTKRDYPSDTFNDIHCAVFDECLTYDQMIITDKGPVQIGTLFNIWNGTSVYNNKIKNLPKVLSYNEKLSTFEFKNITYAWEKTNENIIKISYGRGNIKCTQNHKILTPKGYVEADKLKVGDLIKCCLCSSANKQNYYPIEPPSINNTLYEWNYSFLQTGTIKIKSIDYTKNPDRKSRVYDLEIEDNHNFVLSTGMANVCGPIVHNCHHLGAQVFSQLFFKLGTKMTLGLSATPKRTDGLTKVIEWFLGHIIKNEMISDIEKPTIKFIEAEYSSNIVPKFNFKGNLNSQNMINQLVLDDTRNKQIIDEIIKLYKEGRKILVLSARRGHCEFINEQLIKNNVNSGLYLGGMTNEALEKSNIKNVIIATYSMVSEAYDNSSLDTLIMATGISSVTQSIGRILRVKNKFSPLVVDFTDIEYFGGQARRRKQFYKKNGYKFFGNTYTKENRKSDSESDSDDDVCLFDDPVAKDA